MKVKVKVKVNVGVKAGVKIEGEVPPGGWIDRWMDA